MGTMGCFRWDAESPPQTTHDGKELRCDQMGQELPSPICLALGDSWGARGPSPTKEPGQFCVVIHTQIKGKTRLGCREMAQLLNQTPLKAGPTTQKAVFNEAQLSVGESRMPMGGSGHLVWPLNTWLFESPGCYASHYC